MDLIWGVHYRLCFPSILEDQVSSVGIHNDPVLLPFSNQTCYIHTPKVLRFVLFEDQVPSVEIHDSSALIHIFIYSHSSKVLRFMYLMNRFPVLEHEISQIVFIEPVKFILIFVYLNICTWGQSPFPFLISYLQSLTFKSPGRWYLPGLVSALSLSLTQKSSLFFFFNKLSK